VLQHGTNYLQHWRQTRTTIIRFSRKPKVAIALKGRENQSFQLSAKTDVTYNSILFRFELPSKNMRLGLPVGKHVLLSFTESDNLVSRPYTPVTSDEELGFFDLLIKVYPTGKMGNYLKNLPIGKSVNVKGPQGMIEYFGNGKFCVRRKYKANPQQAIEQVQHVKTIGMIAGGTGLTPMLQIIRAVLKHSQTDKTKLSLIFANVAEEDILLRAELEKYEQQHSSQFHLFYTLDKPSENWTGGRGFVSAEMIAKHLPPPSPDTLILICGPPPMLGAMEKNLGALDFKEEHYFKY